MRTESTPGARGPVFCGVDTHADSHWLCVLDWRGRKVLSRQFPADAAGYEALAGAIAAAGEPACVAMEGTSSYGAGLTRHLASLGMPVREALSPARMQRRRPGQGKCDEADAERAARAAMSGSKLGTPKSQDGWVDGVRCMLAARSGAVKARTSAINTARSLLTTAPEGLRSRFRGMGGPRLMEELPSVRAEGALGAALGALADLWEVLASIYFSPFSPTYFRQSRQRGCAGFANADAPLSASRLPPPSRPHRRWIRPSGGTTVPLS